MNTSSVLRQQSQNKITSDFQRMKNEQNKMPAHTKPSKLLSTPHLSNLDTENKDPRNPDMCRKTPVGPGVSKLPVLAKSLRLQTPSDFGQSHCRWEEKPLAGKAKKKKPCTRPIPFNLSQPKSSRAAAENQKPLTVNNLCDARLKTPNLNVKPTKQPTVLNTNANKGTGKASGKAIEKTCKLPGQSGPSNTFKPSTAPLRPLSSIPNNTTHHSSIASSAQAALNAEACLDNMNLLSLKDPTKPNMQPTAQGGVSKSSTDKAENFQPDHAAFLSILRNEGVSALSQGAATPSSNPYKCGPQRMSVIKSRPKVGPTTDLAAMQSILQSEGVKAGGPVGATPGRAVRPSARGASIYKAQRVPARESRLEATGGPTGSMKSVQLSPDSSALQSILQNEGVKAGGPVGATPGRAIRPARGTSVYKAQRVPARESRAEATGGPTGSMKSVQFSPDSAALQSILQNEGVKAGGPVGATPGRAIRPSRGTSVYTAQRVLARESRREATRGPAVALKESPLKKWTPQRVCDTRPQPPSAMKWHLSTPCGATPGLHGGKTNLQSHQEDVVQRLFDDQEDEQSGNMTDKDPETRAGQLPVQATTTKSYIEEKVETSRDEDEGQRIVGRQPFFQEQQRESVIFFSTSKKLLKTSRFEPQESSGHHKQPGLDSSEQSKALAGHGEASSVSEPTSQTSLRRDLIVQKTCALSPAVAILRKRLPPLEELRMDEEVATYTSVSAPAVPRFLPPRPRCGNPLASILHFEESSRFVPIDCDVSPDSSPVQER